MLIDPTAPYGKFVHVIGPSGSGKGTLLRLWGEIFGLEDSHSGDFAELSNPESRHQHLTGKSLYAVPDTGGYITGIRPFYELVDNGKLSGRSLYSSCGYTKEWNCRFVVASVDHLQIENAGDGWDRRCLPLLSKGREGLEDPYLRHKLSKAHGYSDNRGMSKFIAHLKTVIPQHHVPRHRKDGELQPARWTHMTLLPGVMVDVSEDASNGYQGKPSQPHPEPEWRCAKFRCSEGGLLAFEEWHEQQKMRDLIPDFNQQDDRGTAGSDTAQSTPIGKNIAQNQGFEGGGRGGRGTAP